MRLATIVISTIALCGTGLMAQDDLAKFQEHMKAVAAANGALGKAITDKDATAATANANTIATNFEWIADFFKGKGKDDAVGFAKAAGAAAKAVAEAKTPEDMAAARTKLGPNCMSCHMVYRAGQAFKGM